MDIPTDDEWGYFDAKTEAAVNKYKNDMGLGNTGTNKGVVGLQTWKSLGLIYREKKDIEAGVKIVTMNFKQYFDISKPVNDAVYRAKSEFEQHEGDLVWFRAIVGDNGKWNVKRTAEVWADTLGISTNSYNQPLLFYGRPVVIDEIGNITYGYLGKAAGIYDTVLMAGSMGNHIKNHFVYNMNNEMHDEALIQLGINWYNGIDIQARLK